MITSLVLSAVLTISSVSNQKVYIVPEGFSEGLSKTKQAQLNSDLQAFPIPTFFIIMDEKTLRKEKTNVTDVTQNIIRQWKTKGQVADDFIVLSLALSPECLKNQASCGYAIFVGERYQLFPRQAFFQHLEHIVDAVLAERTDLYTAIFDTLFNINVSISRQFSLDLDNLKVMDAEGYLKGKIAALLGETKTINETLTKEYRVQGKDIDFPIFQTGLLDLILTEHKLSEYVTELSGVLKIEQDKRRYRNLMYLAFVLLFLGVSLGCFLVLRKQWQRYVSGKRMLRNRTKTLHERATRLEVFLKQTEQLKDKIGTTKERYQIFYGQAHSMLKEIEQELNLTFFERMLFAIHGEFTPIKSLISLEREFQILLSAYTFPFTSIDLYQGPISAIAIKYGISDKWYEDHPREIGIINPEEDPLGAYLRVHEVQGKAKIVYNRMLAIEGLCKSIETTMKPKFDAWFPTGFYEDPKLILNEAELDKQLFNLALKEGGSISQLQALEDSIISKYKKMHNRIQIMQETKKTLPALFVLMESFGVEADRKLAFPSSHMRRNLSEMFRQYGKQYMYQAKDAMAGELLFDAKEYAQKAIGFFKYAIKQERLASTTEEATPDPNIAEELPTLQV